MLILGHEDIDHPLFCRVNTTKEIQKTDAGTVLYIDPFDTKLAAYMHQNALPFCAAINCVSDLMLANAQGAAYCLIPLEHAKEFQALANEYLFDAKLLLAVDSTDAIKDAARLGVDGVIFQAAFM